MAENATNVNNPLFVIDSLQPVSTPKFKINFSLSLVDDEIIRLVIQKIQIHPELWNIKSLAYKVSNQTKSNVYKDKAVYDDGKKDKEGRI
uniref:Uncharacterized protein n=1 Tax=Acrobeloides nanus TaxID=290746 RepID=A0A914D3F9_9BILA